MVFDLFSKKTNVADCDWIAVAGLVSDSAYGSWKKFVDQVLRKYGLEGEEDIFRSVLGKTEKRLGALWMFKERERAEKTFKFLYNARSYRDILKNGELREAKEVFDKEMQRWIDRREDAEVFENDLIIFTVKSQVDLSSPLSTVLSFKFFIGKTVVVVADTGKETVKISGRNQVGVRVNDLFREAVEGILNAKTGGHAQACSTQIERGHLGLFKNNLKKAFRRQVLFSAK